MREEMIPGNVCRGFLFNGNFLVRNLKTDRATNTLTFEYQDFEGNWQSFEIDNGTEITVRDGDLTWKVELPEQHKVQMFALILA
jgi:hypothetical protein